jgi:hypothetical protein
MSSTNLINKLLAYHEAGHAVVGEYFGLTWDYIDWGACGDGAIYWDKTQKQCDASDVHIQEIMKALAGNVSVMHFFPDAAPASGIALAGDNCAARHHAGLYIALMKGKDSKLRLATNEVLRDSKCQLEKLFTLKPIVERTELIAGVCISAMERNLSKVIFKDWPELSEGKLRLQHISRILAVH